MIRDEKDWEEQEGEPLVELTDENGEVSYFIEEAVLELDGKRFAVLAPVHDDEDENCACCGDQDDDDYELIARIDVDENGEDVYVDPSDEEYQAVCRMLESYDSGEEEE
ncbi:MAG: DUF1292 domain-containing protein [Negativicutes bacterium]|nr:DUF1292 domain-containing protein [Negativicutes bacterium]